MFERNGILSLCYIVGMSFDQFGPFLNSSLRRRASNVSAEFEADVEFFAIGRIHTYRRAKSI